jgi:hypothetical protein
MFVLHSLLSHLHVYFGHITHHSYSNQHCFRQQLSAGAHKRAFVTFGDSLILRQLQEFHLSLLFSPLQEDNVAIAIAMNGINIFHEYDLIYLFFLPHRNIVLLAPL